MRIDATKESKSFHIYDLDTGEEIHNVMKADTDNGMIERSDVDDDGRIKIVRDGGVLQMLLVTEMRKFRIVSIETGEEIGRTKDNLTTIN